MYKFLSYAGAILILFAAIASCSSSDKGKGARSITVGWIGPLTGSADVLGIDNLNAVKLALAEYETHKVATDPSIKLIIADDKYRDDLTVNAYDKIVAIDKPVAIILSTYSGISAVADRALKDSIMIIDPVDNDRNLSGYNYNIFLIGKETESLAAIDANAIMDQGKKNTVVIYYGSDQFMPMLAKTLSNILLSNGNQVKLFDYNVGTTDFKSFLEWGKDHNADSYAFFGYQEIGIVIKQAREMGITAPFYTANIAIRDLKSTDGLLEGTYYPDFTSFEGNKVQADEFLFNYNKIYKTKPFLEWSALQAYDAASILFNAIKAASYKEGDFSNNLRDQLLRVANFEGVSGMITILPSGASRGIYPELYIFKGDKQVRAFKPK